MAVTKKAKEPVDEKASFVVMLGNNCSRYLAPDGTMYETNKKYTVSDEKRKELFGFRDDFGARFFYDAVVIERQKALSKLKGRRQEVDEEVEESDEIDTGAMSLEDEDGNPVGKTV